MHDVQYNEWAKAWMNAVPSCGQASFSVFLCSGLYLQGESNNFETLLHCIKLFFEGGVVNDVRPYFNGLVTQIPVEQKRNKKFKTWFLRSTKFVVQVVRNIVL